MAANLRLSQIFNTYLCGATLGLALLLGCSGSPDASAPATPTTSGGDSATELLEKMQAVYRGAKSYTANSRYVRSIVLREDGIERETPFFQMSLAYERPNRIRFRFQEASANPATEQNYEVASNGTHVRSAASSVPDQIHEALAPLALTPENFIPEPEMRAAILGVSLENLNPPLLMLLTDEAERAVFPEDSNPKLLGEKKLGEDNCFRVSLSNPAGKRVLWIDTQSYLLRRMELPIETERKMLDPNDRFSRISIYVDFDDCVVDAEIEGAAFELEIPEQARRVRRFVPPAPPGPSPDMGEPVDDFMFTTLEGKEVNKETFAGKVVVFDFWHTHCPPCRSQTPLLDQVYKHFKGNDQVAFYAVSTDPARISSGNVAKTLLAWGGEMPVLRDIEGLSYEKLNVRVTPTLVLLSGDGRLQMFHRGLHSDPASLTAEIQKLVDGKDLAAAAIARHEEQLKEYERTLDAATIKDSRVEIKVSRPEVPPQKLPEHLQLEQVWQSSPEELKQPGDVLAIEGELRILVLDAGSEIVEMDPTGKVLGRHALPEHPEQRNGFLRTALDGEGLRWYLASGVGWQQVFVLIRIGSPSFLFPTNLIRELARCFWPISQDRASSLCMSAIGEGSAYKAEPSMAAGSGPTGVLAMCYRLSVARWIKNRTGKFGVPALGAP